MVTITILSNELIDVILQQENISIRDVVNFGLTCTRFLAVINDNNVLWQRKLYQRWPYLKRIYDQQIQNKENINFKDNIQASIQCRNNLRSYLSLMSDTFFHKNELADVDLVLSNALFCPSMGAHIMNYYFIVDELLCLIAMYPLLPNCNLTHKFYSKKLLPHVHQHRLKNAWETFLSCPKEQQLLEQGAIIVARWYQPQKWFFDSEVIASLDNFAQQVLEGLKNIHCDHPIFSISAKQFSFWKYNNINDNQWSRKDEKQILDVLRKVFFDELGFCSPSVPNSNVNPIAEHCLIDCVLETRIGNAMSLAVIFQSIARRLGVRCDLVSFPTHFFLSWKPKCDTENSEEEKYFFIDILNGGFIRSRNDCPKTRGRRCPIESFNEPTEISLKEMMLRMINSLQMVNPNYQHYRDRAMQIRSLVEFRYMIEPYNIDAIKNLSVHYLHYHINVSGLLTTLRKLLTDRIDRTSVEGSQIEMILRTFEARIQEEIAQTFLRDNAIPKERTKEMKYAVGMIVNCCNSRTVNHIGVIIWWDKEYNSEVKITYDHRIFCGHDHSDRTQYVTSSNSLKQPFYTVLNENGNTYYIAQDALERAHSPRWIEHKEIGRYFCKFVKSHYVPNNVLSKYFPHDIAILNTLCLPTPLHCDS